MAITKFQPEDVERFLKEEMRLELFQPIIITSVCVCVRERERERERECV